MDEQATARASAGREHPSGFLYLLSNVAMPGLFKIGQTSRNPYARIEELSIGTGVPSPYSLVLAIFVKDRVKAEIVLHSAFERRRLSQSREFFRFSDDAEAIDEVLSIIKGRSIAVAGQDGTRLIKFGPIATDALGSEDRILESLLSELQEVRAEIDNLIVERDKLQRQCQDLDGKTKGLARTLDDIRAERDSVRIERDQLKHQKHMQDHVWQITEWCKANPSKHVRELTDLLMKGHLQSPT